MKIRFKLKATSKYGLGLLFSSTAILLTGCSTTQPSTVGVIPDKEKIDTEKITGIKEDLIRLYEAEWLDGAAKHRPPGGNNTSSGIPEEIPLMPWQDLGAESLYEDVADIDEPSGSLFQDSSAEEEKEKVEKLDQLDQDVPKSIGYHLLPDLQTRYANLKSSVKNLGKPEIENRFVEIGATIGVAKHDTAVDLNSLSNELDDLELILLYTEMEDLALKLNASAETEKPDIREKMRVVSLRIEKIKLYQ